MKTTTVKPFTPLPKGQSSVGASGIAGTRSARALIGWMTPEEARAYSTNHRIAGAMIEEDQVHAQKAREIVAARAPFCPSADEVLTPVGGELTEYLAHFLGQPELELYRREGWVPRIADLRKVCALQHRVFWDYSVSKSASALANDMMSIARVTLPLASEPPSLPLQIEGQNMRWIVASDNPNLQVLGHFSDKTDVGSGRKLLTLGFFVGVEQSYLQVILHRGRYFLRDGYHRAVGLLASGITHAPVLTREYADYAPLGIDAGHLSPDIFLGERPPLLTDYLNDEVAGNVQLSFDRYLVTVDVNKICLAI